MRTFCKWFLIISFSFVFTFMLIWTLVDSEESPDKTPTTISLQQYNEQYKTIEQITAATRPNEPTTRPTARLTTSPETEPEETEPMDQVIFVNYPSFVPSEEPDYREITVEWISPNDGSECYQTLKIDKNAYRYYRELPRYEDFEDYQNYLDDEYNREILIDIADSFRDFGQKYDLSEDEVILEAISFVQSIPYAYDIDSTGEEEFQKFPVETLFDREGDCEDTSLLLAGLLRELGCKVCLLHLPHHIAVGVQDTGEYSGRYFEFRGKQYFYLESTNTGWNIGEMPEKYIDETADILVIN